MYKLISDHSVHSCYSFHCHRFVFCRFFSPQQTFCLIIRGNELNWQRLRPVWVTLTILRACSRLLLRQLLNCLVSLLGLSVIVADDSLRSEWSDKMITNSFYGIFFFFMDLIWDRHLEFCSPRLKNPDAHHPAGSGGRSPGAAAAHLFSCCLIRLHSVLLAGGGGISVHSARIMWRQAVVCCIESCRGR